MLSVLKPITMVQHYTELLQRNTVYKGDCWIYMGKPGAKTGRPSIKVFGGVWYNVSQIALMIKKGGAPIVKGEHACHVDACTSVRCWNPDHIYSGTADSNAEDRVRVRRAREAITWRL